MSSSAEWSDEELRRLRALAKREIRQRMRSIRNVLPNGACALRAEKACARLLELPQLASASCVMAYVALRKELDPKALIEHAWAQGKTVVLPRVDTEADNALTLHVYRQGDELEESGWEILEPLASAPTIEASQIDLIAVPALAIDARGQRIGYGRGFYDRLLPRMPQAYKVGLVYDFQLLAETPNEPHDVALDVVVTDARVLPAERTIS